MRTVQPPRWKSRGLAPVPVWQSNLPAGIEPLGPQARASAVDVTVPVFGNPTTASVRNNFSVIKNEIEELQNRGGGSIDDGEY